MSRSINKRISSKDENIIRKSNELSIAELNVGLTLTQMQLLAFAIYSTQQSGNTRFQKHEFEKKFNIEQYRTDKAYVDSRAIMDLKLTSKSENKKSFKLTNIFTDMYYEEGGTFVFNWHPEIKKHILKLKEKYIVTDLSIAMQFKSSFSWRLYEYLKGHFGYWFLSFTKEELMELFGVQDKKTYIQNTGRFRTSVLETAINEINEYSELEVWYEPVKSGKKITGFEIHWSTGKVESMASESQIKLIHEIKNEVDRNGIEYIKASTSENIIDIQQKIKLISDIFDDTTPELTKEEADNHIKRMKTHLKFLNSVLDKNKDKNAVGGI